MCKWCRKDSSVTPASLGIDCLQLVPACRLLKECMIVALAMTLRTGCAISL